MSSHQSVFRGGIDTVRVVEGTIDYGNGNRHWLLVAGCWLLVLVVHRWIVSTSSLAHVTPFLSVARSPLSLLLSLHTPHALSLSPPIKIKAKEGFIFMNSRIVAGCWTKAKS
jgi:hypothetical protein